MHDPHIITIFGLFKDINDNIHNAEESLKSLSLVAKTVTKLYLNIQASEHEGFRLFNEANIIQVSERHSVLSSGISEFIKMVSTSYIAQSNQWLKLNKSFLECEIFYQNQLAKYKTMKKEFNKKVKKFKAEYEEQARRLRKHSKSGIKVPQSEVMCKISDYKSLIKSYLQDILDIESSIYHQIFICLKDFFLDHTGECKQLFSQYQQISDLLSSFSFEKGISTEQFNNIWNNPIKAYNRYSKRANRIADSVGNFKNDSYKAEQDELIVWIETQEANKGCLKLSPGDVIRPVSDVVNGWQFGMDKKTSEFGWFPASVAKSQQEFKDLLTDISLKVNL